jgi:hypothetical protein
MWKAFSADVSLSKGPARRLKCQIPIKSQKWEQPEGQGGGKGRDEKPLTARFSQGHLPHLPEAVSGLLGRVFSLFLSMLYCNR